MLIIDHSLKVAHFFIVHDKNKLIGCMGCLIMQTCIDMNTCFVHIWMLLG